MVHDGHFVLVVHLVPGADDLDRKAAIFWRNPSGTWKSTGAVKGGFSALREIVGAYKTRVTELEAELDQSKRAAAYFKLLNDIAPILRSARHLHKTLQEAREAMPKEAPLIALRDTAGEIERAAELIQSDAKAGLDFTTAKRAEEQAELSEHIARSSHKLNLIAALTLPMSAIGAVFGVNLQHGLETRHSPWVFWVFVALSFVVGFLVKGWISKDEKRA
jgi:Mg2+ and Co2+ transporter CorA